MIELVSVEVTNFRSFSHALFTPLGIGQGMTAINGSNGMGKSSIVHAIVWALYGVTPDGVRVSALRRQGSDGDVEAKVTFRHDNQTITVTRGLRGRNDTTIAAIAVDGIEQTNVSAKTATAWITSRLGLDAEAFLIAFVIRQKELDSLVRARPADRRKTIERLAGIERMSAALDAARQEARQATRIVDALPPVADLDVATTAVAKATNAITAAQATVTVHTDAANAAAASARTAANAVTAARTAHAAVQTASHQEALAAQAAAVADAEVTRLTAAATAGIDLPTAQALAETARTDLAAAEARLRDVTSAVSAANAAADRAETAEHDADTAAAAQQRTAARIAELDATLATFPSTLDDDLAAAQARVATLADERGAARGEWERLKKAIDTLTDAAAAAATCPTCAHPLDNVDSLIASLTADLATVKDRGTAITTQLADAEATVATLAAQDAARSTAMTNARNAREAAETAADLARRAADTAAKAADEAETLAELAQAAQLAAREAADQLPELQAAATTTQAALRQAETAADAARDLDTARARLATAQDDLSRAQRDHREAITAAAHFNIDDLTAAADQADSDARAAHTALAHAQTELTLAERDLRQAEVDLTQAQANADTRRSALAAAEQAAAVAAALDTFRRDRLARLTPELSEVASDFVARMTDGKYTSVVLDEDFTPILTDATGTERPVAWLSGGEESAVALALRVAIGEVLAGQRGGMLVLDECLTAQDASRRQATMAAIRALPRQIITINHVSESTDMVDLVADVISDGDGASTINQVAAESPLGADVTDQMLDD